MPNFEFLTDNDNVLTGLCSPEANTHLTDLDSQQGSLCDDYQMMSVQSKQGIVSEEAKRLEEAAIYMMDTIYKDCNNLKVPYGKPRCIFVVCVIVGFFFLFLFFSMSVSQCFMGEE